MRSRQRGLDRLAGLRESHQSHESVMSDLRTRFDRLSDPSSAARAVSSFNLFQTPESVASRMATLIPRGCTRILEPSAGLGRLYSAARAVSSAEIVCIDISPDCCRELRHISADDDRCSVHEADFLSVDPDVDKFDCVLMNPPFHMGADVSHIQHAEKFLRPSGTLIAICGTGRKRDRIRESATHYEVLPAGTFRSEGTNVESMLIVIERRSR